MTDRVELRGSGTMRLADVTPRTVVYTSERIGDDKSGMEVREVFYLREPDGTTCRHPHNVRAARIGVAQGDPDDAAIGAMPRYHRFHSPCRDPGEVDGRAQVHSLTLLASGGSIWAHMFQPYLR